MIGINAIARLIGAERYSEVVEGCLRSSMPLPLSIRLQLESEWSIESSAVALGLSRTLELSYRITDGAMRLADRLLASQREDGAFGDGRSPSVTVQALAALASLREKLERDPLSFYGNTGKSALLARVDSAISSACGHLSHIRCVSMERMVHDRETTAYLLVMLSRHRSLSAHFDDDSLERDLLEAGCQHVRAASSLLSHARALRHATSPDETRTTTAA